MRCRACLRTGFTDDELKAHVASTGHVLPTDPLDWKSGKEFAESSHVPKLDKDQLLAALKELGFDLSLLKAAAQGPPIDTLVGAPAAPGPIVTGTKK
jgi:hypothetical protein